VTTFPLWDDASRLIIREVPPTVKVIYPLFMTTSHKTGFDGRSTLECLPVRNLLEVVKKKSSIQATLAMVNPQIS
jgi:hypothetical protein